jgi:type I restriction enzyme R subunit
VSEGKDVGLIVDYYGILDHLDEAIDQYTGEATGELIAHLYDVLQSLDLAIAELPQRHSDLWEVFKTVPHKDDQEAMEQYLGSEPDRLRFYERLTAFAKTLRLAVASVTFHEKTPPDLITRYRRDLKYFMQLRASVARRYAEAVDFKQFQGPIQKLLDTYVGAGEVETLVEPVSILDKEAFARELDAVPEPRAKAEIIANRVRRAIHEHVDEDPVFYKRFSELIDKTLEDARTERISQLELLATMEDIRDRVRDRRAYEEVPIVLRDRDVAKSYYDVFRDEFKAAGLAVSEDDAAILAAQADDIIRSRRKVDWVDDVDVQNQMKTAIEDELFEFKRTHKIGLDFQTIDRLLDRTIDVARRRVP